MLGFHEPTRSSSSSPSFSAGNFGVEDEDEDETEDEGTFGRVSVHGEPPFALRTHWDHEPTSGPSQEGSVV